MWDQEEFQKAVLFKGPFSLLLLDYFSPVLAYLYFGDFFLQSLILRKIEMDPLGSSQVHLISPSSSLTLISFLPHSLHVSLNESKWLQGPHMSQNSSHSHLEPGEETPKMTANDLISREKWVSPGLTSDDLLLLCFPTISLSLLSFINPLSHFFNLPFFSSIISWPLLPFSHSQDSFSLFYFDQRLDL